MLCYLYMMRHFDILKGTSAEHKFRGALAKTLLYIGVPMGLQFSLTAIGSIMSVSYTHLDVYKRQDDICYPYSCRNYAADSRRNEFF